MATTDGTTDYRPLGDHETILPGDICRVPDGSGWVVREGRGSYRTPAEMNVDSGDRWYSRPIPRPAPAEPEPPQPEPAIDPGDGWRLLGEGERIEVDDEVCRNGDWTTPGAIVSATARWARRCAGAVAVRRRIPPLTPAAIHRAAITGNTHDDCLPAMRFGVNCVDGHRRHAASYEDACRVFDEAVRATLAKRGGGA